MGYLIGVLLLGLLAILQSTLLGNFHFYDGRPDLVLLGIIGWGLAGKPDQTMVWALIGGLMLDSLSGIPLGASSIALVGIAYVIGLYRGRIWEPNLLAPLGVTLLASLLYHAYGLAVMYLMGRGPDLGYALSRVVLPSTFLNLLLALPAAQAMQALRLWIEPPEVEI